MIKKANYILSLVLAMLLSLTATQLSASVTPKEFVVVIDAGHGGHDPGALGIKGKEKNINLNVALKLGEYIETNCKDTRVIYTRKRDVFVPLHKRAEIANNAKADLFISIHTNSLAKRNSRICGTETYTLGLHSSDENLEVAKKENAVILIEENHEQQYAGFNPNSSESYIIFEFMQDKNLSQSVNFASEIQKEFKIRNRIDRGVHQAGFLVLRATSMPSVLVELGYISNPKEETYLLSANGTTALAQGIYKAFLTYKNQSKTNKSVTLPAARTRATSEKEVSRAQTTQAKTQSADNGKNKHNTNLKSSEGATKAKPVFKIQILATKKKLSSNSPLFKGLKPVSYTIENGIYKYTYGSDTDYNKIKRLKRLHTDVKFKDAFIIAFKNDKRMNINEAIKEFLHNKRH